MPYNPSNTNYFGLWKFLYGDNDARVAAGLDWNENATDGIIAALSGQMSAAAYNAGAAYTAFTTACSSGGFIYLCIANTTGNAPPNAAYWLLVGPVPASGAAVWHAGSGAPGSGIGNVGDFYLDTAAGNVYQKTGASAWTLEGNITGQAGGATWHVGSGAPSGALGNVNDLYLDSSGTGNWYLKTGASAWTLEGSLTGAPGSPGGAGANGATWRLSNGVPLSSLGNAGDLCLDTSGAGNFYLKNGAITSIVLASGTYTVNVGSASGFANGQVILVNDGTNSIRGTIASGGGTTALVLSSPTTAGNPASIASGAGVWIFEGSILGPTSAPGWHAGSGSPGSGLGAVNDLYLDTATGNYYLKTGSSAWTLQGNLTGAPGSPGGAGANGATWWTGTGAPGTGVGSVNDLYLDTASGNYYLKTGVSTWTLQGNLIGPTGGGILVTSVGSPGLDTNVPSEKAVRTALGAAISTAEGAAEAASDAAGAASTVQGNLGTHAALTITAHGGIVASGDSRLSDARAPTAHESSHLHGGSDVLALPDTINLCHDGGGSAIAANDVQKVFISFACTIVAITIGHDQSATAQFDVLTAAQGSLASAASICGTGTKPNTSAAQESRQTSFTSWAGVAIAAGTWLITKAVSNDHSQKATIAFEVVRT